VALGFHSLAVPLSLVVGAFRGVLVLVVGVVLLLSLPLPLLLVVLLAAPPSELLLLSPALLSLSLFESAVSVFTVFVASLLGASDPTGAPAAVLVFFLSSVLIVMIDWIDLLSM
jgi:hypothetical protein